MSRESEGQEETGVLRGAARVGGATAILGRRGRERGGWTVGEDPSRIQLEEEEEEEMRGENGWFYLGMGGETETSCDTIVELRPENHVGWFLYVLQTHRGISTMGKEIQCKHNSKRLMGEV